MQGKDSPDQAPKPLAVGLEMQQGKWILEADGTLHFFGGSFLLGGGFSAYRKHVRRIVVDDFLMIGDHQFEDFDRCEEVVLNRALVSVGSQAFAHCHKLIRVVHSEDWDAAEDAFLDTPYQAEREGKPFLSPQDRQQSIASGPIGQRFLQSLHDEIERMRTLPEKRVSSYEWDLDEDWFSDSIKLLRKGFDDGEATMMYLYARYIHGVMRILGSDSFEDYIYTDLCPGLEQSDAYDRVLEHEEAIVIDLYQQAAGGGSAHAALWIAFCSDAGLWPFGCDSKTSAKYGAMAKGKLGTLDFDELYFLKQEFLDLVEEAFDADREEDDIFDEYRFREGGYEELLPNPSWRALHLRYIELALFTLILGLPYIPR